MPDFIPFNRPALTGREEIYLDEVLRRGEFSGGPFSKRCNAWLKDYFDVPAVLTTTSGTHALEMAALLCDLKPGDEVILPSYAFPSTATAFARCGASLVFVDIGPGTMNIDPRAVEAAITERTRVIVVLHYGGVACDMTAVCRLAKKKDLLIVEDAAHSIFARYRERLCGTIGTFGCLSFHESKNLHCGDGGALIVNDAQYVERAEVILEKGTDRARFLRGHTDKYTWQDIGSSYILSELNAAFLLAQLEHGHEIGADRLKNWQTYFDLLQPLAERGLIETPNIPAFCQHNGHIFWIKLSDMEERDALIQFLRQNSIDSVFHYIPLHSSPAGLRYGRFWGSDRYTTSDASRLLRLPLFYGFSQAARVCSSIEAFYRVDCSQNLIG